MEAQAEEERARRIALLGTLLAEDGLCASVLHAIPQLSRGAVELPEKVDKGRPLCAELVKDRLAVDAVEGVLTVQTHQNPSIGIVAACLREGLTGPKELLSAC